MAAELIALQSTELDPELDPRTRGMVLRQVRRGDRVLVLGGHRTLHESLRNADCPVLELGIFEAAAGLSALESVRRFQPDVIVAVDSLDRLPSPEAFLRELVDVAPRARFVVAFWNTSSAANFTALLAGASGAAGLADDVLRRWFSSLGLSILDREIIPGPSPQSPYPPALTGALSALFRQLNPTAGDERLLYVAGATAQPMAPAPGPLDGDLLSVVMRSHNMARLPLLDHAIFSIACQEHHPVEIVVATQCVDPDSVPALDELLRKHQHVGRYSYRIVHEPSPTDIRSRLLNLGLVAARGRYVAFLDDDDVVYPQHYRQLIDALRAGSEAWAFSRARRAFLTRDRSGALYCQRKADVFSANTYDRTALIRDNFITSHSYVVDRERLGRFPLRFSEAFIQLEDYLLLLQLSALFPPKFVSGPASCEYRIRDDGSNTVVEGATAEQKAEIEPQWQLARLATMLAKRSIHTLISLEEWDRHVAAAETRAPPPPPPVLIPPSAPRYLLADALNSALKRLPLAHRAIKKLGTRFVR